LHKHEADRSETIVKRILAGLAVIALSAAPAFAAARLTYELKTGPTAIAWPATSFPVPYAIDRSVLQTFGASAQQDVENAFTDWTKVADSRISFRFQGVVDNVPAGTDGRNVVTMADNMFGPNSFLARTTYSWDSAGNLYESDIQLDASTVGKYSVEQLVEHEVGHFLGLDHSAVASAVMFPFVPENGTPGMDSDDRLAISSVYPAMEPSLMGGILRGTVTNDRGGVFAAQVVAVDGNGQPVATGLTSADGTFELKGLPTGSYRVYAEPLDGPVSPSNLAGIYAGATNCSFRTQFLASPVQVTAGRATDSVSLRLNGMAASLNPRFIGAINPQTYDTSLGAMAMSVRPGETVSIAVAGDGFTSGMTTFEVMNPAFKRTSDFRYAANFVFATFTVSPNAAPGSAVVMVNSGSDAAALTGGLRIETASAAGKRRGVRPA
jgi:Matrixin